MRRHPVTMLRTLAVPALALLLDFFFLSWLVGHGPWGVWMFLAVFLVAAVAAARGAVMWAWDVFLITDTRVIDVDQRGFFHRTVAEAAYDAIQDVRFSVSGIWQTLFSYGDVQVQTAGAQATIEATAVRRPQAVQELLIRLQRERTTPALSTGDVSAHTPESSARAQELLATLKRIREDMGHERFDALISTELRKDDTTPRR